MKLQKFLASQGCGARRAMERAIAQGLVTVNDETAHTGQVVSESDSIKYKNKLILWPEESPKPQLLIYHKPLGEICTRADPQGRPTVFDKLPVNQKPWIIIGRLDIMTSGLLLFTDNGDLANQYMHPSFNIQREYQARIQGKLTQDQLNQLKQGIILSDGPAKVEKIIPLASRGTNTEYQLTLTEGRNREVRRLFAHFGFTVNRLRRIRFGGILLPQDLNPGTWVFVK